MKLVVLLLCISVAAGTYTPAEPPRIRGALSSANEVTTEKQGLIAGKQEERAMNHDEREDKYQAALKTIVVNDAIIAKKRDVHERETKKIASFKDIIFSLKERTASLGEQSGTGTHHTFSLKKRTPSLGEQSGTGALHRAQVQLGEQSGTGNNRRRRRRRRRPSTGAPTAAPTIPTAAPTIPTGAPTAAPTGAPTAAPTGAPTAAPTILTNPAKCAGSDQNHTDQTGTLDCDSCVQSSAHTGKYCLDNLSNAAFWVAGADGRGQCVDFTSNEAFVREAQVVTTNNTQCDPPHFTNPGMFPSSRYGTISKLFTAAVDTTDMTATNKKRYGVISGKRMVCTDSICHVFKVGMCIKCPAAIFSSESTEELTKDDVDKFVVCCVQGTRDKFGRQQSGMCDAAFEVDHGAFTHKNKAAATLKDSYQCWDGTDEDADGLKAQTLAFAMIKAS